MFYVSFISEILAMATGLVLFNRIKPVALRLLVFILVITVINEALAFFSVYKNAGLNKSYFYNGFFLIELICFFLIFFHTYFNHKYKLSVTYILILSLIVAIYFLFANGIGKFNPFFLDAICFALLGLGISYYFFIYNSPVFYSLKKDPIFWFSTGIIIANFIHLLFVNATFIESFRSNPGSKHIFQTLNTVGNVFYYGCIIISFVCSSRYLRQVGT